MQIKYKKISALFLITFCCFFANAQTNEEVTIQKDYEAKLREADKLMVVPPIPEMEEKKRVLEYAVPSRDFKDIPFVPNPLKPIGMSKEKIEKLCNSYLKVGFGSQLTPLVELAYNDTKSKNLKFGVFYNHLSQYGFKIKNQKFSTDEPGVYLKYYPKTFELGTAFRFKNNRIHYYYAPDSVFASKDVRQVFRNYDGAVTFKNVAKNQYEMDFNSGANFNYLQETYGKGYEYFLHANLALDKHFKKYHTAGGKIDFDYSSYKTSIQKLDRNLFFLNLHYLFNNDDWKARAGITFGIDGSKFYPLPDLYLEKRLYEHKVIAFAGWEIRYQKNSFKTFSDKNPFILSNINLTNSRINDVYAGFKGTMGGFSYLAQFSYKTITNMAFYLTDTLDTKRFYIAYDKSVKDLGGHIELGYNYADELKILFSSDFNSYRLSSQAKAWYEPLYKGNLKVNYVFRKKIVVGFDVFGWSTYYGLVAPNTIKKINGTADINLSLEYILNKHISFFGTANNLAHQRYEKWANYPVYGVNGLVGAKFSF